MRLIPLAAGLTAAALLSAGCGVLGGSPSHDPQRLTLTKAIDALDVAEEDRTGYDRDEFPHWTDADDDGCNTRYEVLIDEAATAPDVGSRCRLSGGEWDSYYDGETWTVPADLDVDHLVPLAEAWDSGARDWTGAKRERYANDLDEDRTLAAVTDNVNQSKGDKDPAEWLPPRESAHCRYLAEWTAVKSRWRLSVDAAEKKALTELAGGCEDVELSFEYAR